MPSVRALPHADPRDRGVAGDRAVDETAGRSRARSRGHPGRDFAAEQLTRRWRKIRKRAKHSRGSMRAVATNCASRPRSCVMLRSSSPPCSRASGRRSGERDYFPALERLQDGLGDSTTSLWTKNASTAIGIRRGSKPNRACAAGLLSEREDTRRSKQRWRWRPKHMRNWPRSNRSGDDAAAGCSGRDY